MFLEDLAGRNLLRFFFFGFMGEILYDLVNIDLFDSALTNNDPDVAGHTIFIKTTQNCWMRVEFVLVLRLVLEDGGEFAHREIVDAKMSSKLEEVAFFSHG